MCLCVCVCVCVCMRACVRACVRASARARKRALFSMVTAVTVMISAGADKPGGRGGSGTGRRRAARPRLDPEGDATDVTSPLATTVKLSASHHAPFHFRFIGSTFCGHQSAVVQSKCLDVRMVFRRIVDLRKLWFML